MCPSPALSTGKQPISLELKIPQVCSFGWHRFGNAWNTKLVRATMSITLMTDTLCYDSTARFIFARSSPWYAIEKLDIGPSMKRNPSTRRTLIEVTFVSKAMAIGEKRLYEEDQSNNKDGVRLCRCQ
jgi:hypothetical protein